MYAMISCDFNIENLEVSRFNKIQYLLGKL